MIQFIHKTLHLLLIASFTFMLVGCEADLAPDRSTLSVLPGTISLGDVGTAGDITFITLVATVQDSNNNPIDNIDIQVKSFFLRIVDGNDEFADSPVTFTTDSNGQVVLSIEVPLATDVSDTISFSSGSIIGNDVNITVSSSS